MKNLMRLGMMALLIATFSCNETQKKDLATNEALAMTARLESENQEDCYSDTQLTRSIAESWESAYNIYQSEKNIVGARAYPPRFHFNTDQIQTLSAEKNSFNEQNTNIQIDGVSIYYVVVNRNTDSGPGYTLYMRNIICGGSFNSINNPTILKATITLSDGGADFSQGPQQDTVTESNFTTDSENWYLFRDTNFPEMPQIKGYNYSWAQINEAMYNEGLSIHVGLKAITPEEGSSVYDSGLTEAEQVLCNITYIGLPDDEYNGAVLFDFAKPCPHYCND